MAGHVLLLRTSAEEHLIANARMYSATLARHEENETLLQLILLVMYLFIKK